MKIGRIKMWDWLILEIQLSFDRGQKSVYMIKKKTP